MKTSILLLPLIMAIGCANADTKNVYCPEAIMCYGYPNSSCLDAAHPNVYNYNWVYAGATSSPPEPGLYIFIRAEYSRSQQTCRYTKVKQDPINPWADQYMKPRITLQFDRFKEPNVWKITNFGENATCDSSYSSLCPWFTYTGIKK